MAKQLLFTFKSTGVAPRNGETPPQLRVSLDTVTGDYIVEEATLGTNWQTRATAGAIVKTYVIVAGVRSAYAPCLNGDLYEYFSSTTFPYASLTVTEDSPFCQAGADPDDVFIDVDAFDETLPGNNDGKAIINTTSLKPIILYQLTRPNGAQIEQTGNAFTNLTPGVYTIRVVAEGMAVENGPVATFTINAATFDEYGVFIRCRFDTYGDAHKPSQNIKLEIRKKGYSGVVRENCAVGTAPIMLSYKGASGDTPFIFSHIFGLSLDFSLEAEDVRDLSVLYTQDEREYLVELRDQSEDRLIFRGFLLPEFLNMQYTDIAHEARFTASDGLGTMKNYLFLKTNGERYTGKYTIEQLLNVCLGQVNLDIPVYSAIKWDWDHADTLPEGDRNIFSELTIDAGLFYVLEESPTLEDVVYDILQSFAATIAQVNGKLLIWQPYEDKAANETFFTISGGESLPAYSNSAASITGGENVMTDQNPTQTAKPGVEQITVTETLQPIAGLVKNSNLQNVQAWQPDGNGVKISDWLTGSVSYTCSLTATGTVLIDGKFANYYSTRSVDLTTLQKTDSCDGFVFKDIRTRATDAKVITYNLGQLNREQPVFSTSELGFLLYLKIKTQQVNSDMAFNIGFQFIADNGIIYRLDSKTNTWTVFSATNVTWLTYLIARNDTGQELEVSYTTPALPEGFLSTPFPMTGFFRIEISEPYICKVDNKGNILPGDPNSLITGFASQTGFPRGDSVNVVTTQTKVLCIEQVQVKPLVGGNELNKQTKRTYLNQGAYTTQKIESKVLLGSHYYGKNNERFYPYAPVIASTGKAATLWKDQEGNKYQFSELSHRTLIKARQIPREQLAATLYGSYDFNKRLRLLFDNNLEYFCIQYSRNLLTNMIDVVLIYAEGEFPRFMIRLNEDGTVKLLEDGTMEIRAFERNYIYDEDFTTI